MIRKVGLLLGALLLCWTTSALAQPPTMTTAQKVKITVVGKDDAGTVVPIPAGSMMQASATSDTAVNPGDFVDGTVVGEYSTWYVPKVEGTHTIYVRIVMDGKPDLTATLTIKVLPSVYPTSITLSPGTPVAKAG